MANEISSLADVDVLRKVKSNRKDSAYGGF